MTKYDDFSRLELSLPACRSNYRYFRSLLRPSTKLLVLVKANAYGHGAVEFASMMQAEGADYLAVALPVEGVELRRNGISLPILVLTAGTDFFPEIIENRLEPGIPNLYTLQALCDELARQGIKDFPIHIKLDTGMHRLGFMTSEIPALLALLSLKFHLWCFRHFHQPIGDLPGLKTRHPRPFSIWEYVRMLPAVLISPILMLQSARTYVNRFASRQIRELLGAVVQPEINALSLIYILVTFAQGDSGYPVGGSVRMAGNMAGTFTSLGGEIRYRTPALGIEKAAAGWSVPKPHRKSGRRKRYEASRSKRGYSL